jgi:hypothetical protein
MALKTLERTVQTAQTSGTTTTTIATFSIPATATCIAQASVIGRDASGNSVITRQLVAAKRQGGGAGALVGSVVQLVSTLTDIALTGTTVTMDVNGNDIRVRATGILGSTIDWETDLEVQLS